VGVIIISPTLGAFPQTVLQPLVEIKQNWTDAWFWAPEIRIQTMSAVSAGQDLSELVLLRPYGPTKHPWEADFPASIDTAVNLTDWWVRVRSLTGEGPELSTVWLGRFSAEKRNLYGSSQGLSGMQMWVAYGPAQILRKRFIDKSHWLVSSTEFEEAEEQLIGWVPPVNDPQNSERGNRTTATPDGVYVYGGEELWDYRQHVEYLLKKFLDESDGGGPEWRLAGAAEVLEDLKEPITWDTTQSAAEMLAKLIPVSRGLDYTIRLISDGDEETGFEVFVYALSAQSFSFGGATLPANPDTVQIEVGEANNNEETLLVLARDHYYSRLRVVGKRIVVCCSLWGELAAERANVPLDTIGVPDPTPDPPPPADPLDPVATLVPSWLPENEESYRESVGNLSEAESDHDEYRNQDKFHAVYQSFGVVKKWDWNAGTAAPLLDDEGELVEADEPVPGDPPPDDVDTIADYQNTVRHTLSWIPLFEGFDYTRIRFGITDETPRDVPPDYLSPMAWMFDPFTYRYVLSEELDIGAQPKRHDWGVVLQSAPNHLVGENHFDEQDEEDLDYVVITALWPRYDHEEMAVTIAMESDQRFAMESNTKIPAPGDPPEPLVPSDGVLIIETDAEFHYLAPNTIVGVSEDRDDPNGLLILSGDDPYILRSDKDLMELTMAAAISRYQADRMRARLSIFGFLPWQHLVGRILATVEEAGQVHRIDAPITAITWQVPDDGGSPRTILEAGFAQ